MFRRYEEVSKNMVNNINRKIRKISKTFGMNLLPYEVPTSGVCHHMYWVMDEDYTASYAWMSAKAMNEHLDRLLAVNVNDTREFINILSEAAC